MTAAGVGQGGGAEVHEQEPAARGIPEGGRRGQAGPFQLGPEPHPTGPFQPRVRRASRHPGQGLVADDGHVHEPDDRLDDGLDDARPAEQFHRFPLGGLVPSVGEGLGIGYHQGHEWASAGPVLISNERVVNSLCREF